MSEFTLFSERIDQITPNKIEVITSTLLTPRGDQVTWGIFNSRDAVVVLGLAADNRVYLKREWRLNRKDYCWEVVSGWVEESQPTSSQLRQAAARELQEEVGQKPGKLTHLLTMYPTNHFRGKWHLFLAEQLTPSQLPRDEHEYLAVELVPFQLAYTRVVQDQIPTAQNALIFELVKNHLNIK